MSWTGLLSAVLLTSLFFLQGCGALRAPDFEVADAENLEEWQIEGRLRLRGEQGREDTWFTFTQINGSFDLALLPDAPVSEPGAVLRAEDMHGTALQLMARDQEARALGESIREQLPVHHLAYWLRGLPATPGAEMTHDAPGHIRAMRDAGWDIQYRDLMRVNNYMLPERMRMTRDGLRVDIDLVRAETGYLSSPCPRDFLPEGVATRDAEVSGDAGNADRDRVAELVPPDGSAPMPRWVDRHAFCAQLYKVHGKIPDPRVGLYGPDSMMWRLQAPMAPGGLGAGRALLLQNAHPWVTRGVDEHSVVRDDPLGRARRTFQHVFTIVYGSMPQVMGSANQVHAIHESIEGDMPYDAGAFKQGTEYRANEINAMIWVHATLWETLAKMYEQIKGTLTDEEKEQFYQESKLFAMVFGIPEDALPRTWPEFLAYNEAMWRSEQLTVTDATQQLRKDLFRAQSVWLIGPMWAQRISTAANLPEEVREKYEIKYGAWQKTHYFWIKNSARVASFVLPGRLENNPFHHEAHARLEGERPGFYQRWMIRTLMGQERLVN
ncbi:oxygenase MpaB family protein [Alcanivorax sp. JB21]|uniref:lipoprotein insertase outer membrane protein LolB n=1 Tax=Alcanivorax limicola TaxID=2874102 RepID=UPI001CBC49D8|nr:lipoprotein insertase outer membrane protein LolB [Alcanivorax limicola]MBZ2188690.1 oxygenase MpaB family protein [Alcanivorax limicola]